MNLITYPAILRIEFALQVASCFNEDRRFFCRPRSVEELQKEEIDAILGKKPESGIIPDEPNSYPVINETVALPATS